MCIIDIRQKRNMFSARYKVQVRLTQCAHLRKGGGVCPNYWPFITPRTVRAILYFFLYPAPHPAPPRAARCALYFKKTPNLL